MLLLIKWQKVLIPDIRVKLDRTSWKRAISFLPHEPLPITLYAEMMREDEMHVEREAAIAAVEEMLSSAFVELSETENSILSVLLTQYKDRKPGLQSKGLYESLKNPTISVGSIRSAMQRLQEKIARYNEQARKPVKVIVTDSPYRLLIPSREMPDANVRLLLDRNDRSDPFPRIIHGDCEDIFFMTIASQDTFAEKIEPWFRAGSVKTKHFRVLALKPNSGSNFTVQALAAVFGLNEGTLKNNIELAWKNWKGLEDQHPSVVEVYGYDSIPTALAVFDDQTMRVEFLPFNPVGGERRSLNRPAIIIDAVNNQPGYAYFRKWFDDLWFTAMYNAKEEEVHENWRERRKALLKEWHSSSERR
jgi:hypothetical protein